MQYILLRNGRYYFNRRVPETLRKLEPREYIRFALKTSDRKAAQRLAVRHNEQLEAYWNTLLITGQNGHPEEYKAISSRATHLGFPYYPSEAIAALPIQSIIQRTQHVAQHKLTEAHVEAVMGKCKPPSLPLSLVFDKYYDLSKGKLINKSTHQVRKWRNPRVNAIQNLIRIIGNKTLTDIARDDVQKFRDWWIERVKTENLSADSANKQIIFIKTMLAAVDEDLRIGIDVDYLFKKMLLVNENEKRRLPFATDYITNTLLNSDTLSGLNDQARWSIFACAETGAGINELTGLLPEDIFLDAEIPFIQIKPRKGRVLKTKYRPRTIPLVGYALDAFRACPNGFTKYHDRTDSLSGLLGKYFRQHKLLPTDQHSIYSLRHSFQDRLLSVNTPDRIQADLMGHKFGRPRYGDGATLAHKLEWMQKICLKHLG
jgi:integrase